MASPQPNPQPHSHSSPSPHLHPSPNIKNTTTPTANPAHLRALAREFIPSASPTMHDHAPHVPQEGWGAGDVMEHLQRLDIRTPTPTIPRSVQDIPITMPREDTSIQELDQDQDQDLPSPTPKFYTITPHPLPSRPIPATHAQTPHTTSTLPARPQPSSSSIAAQNQAHIAAISTDPGLSKRQKKRHMKKQRKRDRLGDEAETETAPEREPEPQLYYNATNTDDFPLLGSSPPPRHAVKDNVGGEVEVRRIAMVPFKMDLPAAPRQILKRGHNTSISSGSTSTFTSSNPPTHPAAMKWNPPPRPRPASSSTIHHIAGSSTSWVSGASAIKDKFERIQKNAGHLGLLNSTAFPQTVGEYARHLGEVKRAGIEWEHGKIERRVQERREASARRKTDLLMLGKYGVEVLGWEGLGGSRSGSGGKYQETEDTGEGLESAFKLADWKNSRNQNERRIERSDLGQGEIIPIDETTFWHPSYEQLPEKRGGAWHLSRAAWPEQNELKAEGEMRARIFGERRLPLPRRDRFSVDAFASKLDGGVTAQELANVKGDDIPWFERQLVEFKGLDGLESVERERVSQTKIWTHEGVSMPAKHQGHGGSRGRFSHGFRDMVRGSSRDTTSMMGSSGMSSPSSGVDALATSFASMGSLEFRGHGAQRLAESSRENRSISGSQAGRSTWAGRVEELSKMYDEYIHAQRRTSPSNPQSQLSILDEPNYESLAWGADGYGDGKSPPPGGWKFDEEYLKERGWEDILKEL